MRKLKNAIKIDRTVAAADNASTGEEKMSHSSKKPPWHLRFAGKMKTAAAAVIVGIALLVGSNGEVQAECDPPLYNVCFHKSDWTSADTATMFVDFDPPPAESGQLYEIVWRGLKKIHGVGEPTYENFSDPGKSDSEVAGLSYEHFWCPEGITEDSYESYGVELYEGHWDYSTYPETGYPTWVRGDWIGSASLYNHQEAAEINVDASLFPDFNYWTYYCTVDWQSAITPLKYGYILGCWYWDSRQSDYIYTGVHGSPRFDYQQSCSYEFSPRQFVGGFCNDSSRSE